MKLPADDKLDHSSLVDLDARMEAMEHYSKTILALSVLNGVMNVATIAVGFFVAMY